MANNRRYSAQQMEYLIDYMADHPIFAKGQITCLGPTGKVKYDNMWSELANFLNKQGPAIKAVAQWKKVIIRLYKFWKNFSVPSIFNH